MLNKRVKTVIKREIRTQLMSKSFIILTVMMPIIWFGLFTIQAVVMNYKSDDKFFIQIISENEKLSAELEKKFSEEDFVKGGQFQLDYSNIKSEEIEQYINDVRDNLLNKDISGIFYIPDSAEANKEITYFSTNPKNRDITRKIRSTINDVLVSYYFKDKEINKNDISYAQKRVIIHGKKITKSGSEDDGFGNLILAGVFTFLLFLSIIMIGQSLMQAVTEEKTNRIVEVLLSSVNPAELMTGKIIGTAITGLFQMFIWALPVIVASSGIIPMLAFSDSLNLNLNFAFFPYFFINYLIGLLIYLGLFGSFGAIFDNPQDAQQSIWPLMMLIMIPFYMSFGLIANPSNAIAEIGSLVPFASIMIMPARMALIDLPWWQPLTALAVNIVTLFAVLYVSGKIYKIGIMTTGKKPKWSEVVKWIKEA